MKTATAVPTLNLTFEVEIEVAYNSFGGKTPDEIAEALQDEMHDLLFEIDKVVGVSSACQSLSSKDA